MNIGTYGLPVGGDQRLSAHRTLVFDEVLTSQRKAIDTGWTIPPGRLLEVYMLIRTTDAAAAANVGITVNGDTSSIYDFHGESVNNTTVAAIASRGQANWRPVVHGGGGSSGYPSVIHIVIPGHSDPYYWKVGHLNMSTPDATAANLWHEALGIGYRSQNPIGSLQVTAEGSAFIWNASRMTVFVQ